MSEQSAAPRKNDTREKIERFAREHLGERKFPASIGKCADAAKVSKPTARFHLLALVDAGRFYTDEGRYIPIDLPRAEAEKQPQARAGVADVVPFAPRRTDDNTTPPGAAPMARAAA